MRPCKKKVLLVKRVKTPNSLDEFIIVKEPWKYNKSYPIYILKRNQLHIYEDFSYRSVKRYMEEHIDILTGTKVEELIYKEGY